MSTENIKTLYRSILDKNAEYWTYVRWWETFKSVWAQSSSLLSDYPKDFMTESMLKETKEIQKISCRLEEEAREIKERAIPKKEDLTGDEAIALVGYFNKYCSDIGPEVATILQNFLKKSGFEAEVENNKQFRKLVLVGRRKAK